MMKSGSRNISVVLALLALFLLVASPAMAKGEVRYTKVNFHTQTKDGNTHKGSYANYTNPGAGHVIIPVGSEIVITKTNRKAFYYTFDGGTKKGVFEYHEPRMGMPVKEYIDIVTSAEPTTLSGLSKVDREGVAAGKALVGMSRNGVMAALGYPAAHKTPSLDSPTWIYWANRFRTVGVDFDASGKVRAVR